MDLNDLRLATLGGRDLTNAAPGLKPPPRPLTWLEVGEQFKRLYETLLSTPRSIQN